MQTRRMYHHYSRIRLLSTALVLSACQDSIYSMPDFNRSAGSSAPAAVASAGGADPRLTNNNDAKFFSKSGFEACAGGALVGILACQIGNPSDKKKCMLKAGLVGCGVAMGANYYLDQRRSEYADKEQRLNAMIADVREDNRKLQSLTQTARTVMTEDRQQIAQIKKDIAARTVQKSQAQQQIAEIDANTNYLRETLADLKSREKQWHDVASKERSSGVQVDTLEAEISRMQQQVAALESEINELYQQRSAIQLG